MCVTKWNLGRGVNYSEEKGVRVNPCPLKEWEQERRGDFGHTHVPVECLTAVEQFECLLN